MTHFFASSYQKKATNTQNEKKQHLNIEFKNNWFWIGPGLIYTFGSFNKYTSTPFVDYQIGFARAFWKGDEKNVLNGMFNGLINNNMLYGAFIYDFAYSSTNMSAGTSRYYLTNGSFVLGYEQGLMNVPNLSFFGEIGPSIGQRAHFVEGSSCPGCFGGSFTLNGLINLGMNIDINPHDRVSYMIRLATQFMFGTSANQDNCPGRINANPFMIYAPVLAFVVRY